MLRSRYLTITTVDKATYLWVLCTIEWMHEHNEPISNNNLTKLFGEQIKNRFNFYREIAIEAKDLAHNGIQLTDKGQKIVNNWRRHNDYIYDVSA